jgi:hypothetical protein
MRDQSASERDGDEILEVRLAQREGFDEWPHVDEVGGAELDPVIFAVVKRDLATEQDGDDLHEID